jgi:hypothetical protein
MYSKPGVVVHTIIPVFGRQRQEDLKIVDNLDHIARP